ncbi:MAG: helix-turn-helix domain-containing protein [Acidimicrobiales bacterium]
MVEGGVAEGDMAEDEWVVGLPAPSLRAFVRSYVGYRTVGQAPRLHRGLPSRFLTMIVSIGPPIEVAAHTDRAQPPARYRAVLSGLQASPALIADPGHGAGVAIELSPLGLRNLLGMPAAALWNTSYELADIAGPLGDELWQRAQGATWPEVFAACDDVLERLAAPDRAAPPELAHAWRLLARSGGAAPIGSLAADVGWTRQHLAARFRRELGLSPKLAARVIRFERARRMLRAVPAHVTIAQVAASCGYYDQAHLNRDFAAFAGASPSRWAADERLPSFQDRLPEDL